MSYPCISLGFTATPLRVVALRGYYTLYNIVVHFFPLQVDGLDMMEEH